VIGRLLLHQPAMFQPDDAVHAPRQLGVVSGDEDRQPFVLDQLQELR
jgi:hypothetical protein